MRVLVCNAGSSTLKFSLFEAEAEQLLADGGNEGGIARVYRHGRVVLHETRDGQVSIVADVPRRLLARLGH